MATLKEEALNYEAPKTKNIADLDIVSVDVKIFEETATDSDGKEFTYKYLVQDGENYRVPNSVLDSIKTIVEEDPSITHVKVKKDGTGLQTRYKVVQKNADEEPKKDSKGKYY